MKRSDFRKRVLTAFSTKFKSIRTAGGVARETELPIEEVIAYLEEHPDTFELLCLRPGGCKLYRFLSEEHECPAVLKKHGKNANGISK